ncbi:MAG TPA: hypothetical protein VNZ25_06845 [Candidatus Angelobacter sp.]|jgi:hypothetical protein|nr:hypothetical protein [Candidatus Angelobacter sp.]
MKANKFATALAGAILLMGVLVPARAQDTKVDPTGTYMWTVPGRNGGLDRTNTLVLKLNLDKLTGNLTAPGRGGQTTTTEVSEGKITGADISFCVVRSFNDHTFTNKYSGTLAAGVITGKMDFERNGEAQSRDWEAKLQQ